MAWTPLGWEPAAFSEIEPFPCSVLRRHYPHVPNLGDVTRITRQQVEALGRIDLVCGGFPCQDLSVAGKRKGLMNADGSATRSGLFFDAMRIAEWARARWTVLENVPGLFSSNDGRDFAAVVGEMAGCEFDVPTNGWENAGVAVGPLGLVEWTTLDAQYVRVESHPRAVPQRRRRVFIVRDSGSWTNRPPLFLERESLCGHPAPRREAGQVAPTIPSRSTGGGGLGTDFDLDGGVIESFAIQAGALRTNPNSGPDGIGVQADHAYTLEARAEVQVVAFAQNSRNEVRLEGGDGQRCGALSTGGGKPAGPATDDQIRGVPRSFAVRRLTCEEAEFLQGFPRSYTAIPWRGKPASECPDGPRYRALGNSWAVNVAAWVGQRIMEVEAILGAQPNLIALAEKKIAEASPELATPSKEAANA